MGASKKVLIVDQGSEIVSYLKNFIPLLGYEAEEARHLIEALAKTNAFKPALMIYNLDLKQAHSRDLFLGEIQKKHPETHLLVLVSHFEETQILKQAGITDFLVKPFNLSDLSERVKALLPEEKPAGEISFAKLLVADDENEIVRFLAEGFRDLGIEVFTAENGRQAVDLFREKACNLALIDLSMPELNGRQVIEELKKSVSPVAPCDIIIMSAALGSSLHDLRRLGYHVFEKPIDLAGLEKVILEDCEKFRLSIHHASAN